MLFLTETKYNPFHTYKIQLQKEKNGIKKWVAKSATKGPTLNDKSHEKWPLFLEQSPPGQWKSEDGKGKGKIEKL